MTRTTSSLHDAYAADYDEQVQAAGSHVAEAVFGLVYEYIQPGQTVLDLGIGTGLSAAIFAKAGLQVHGMDFSPAMLEICRAKGITAALTQHDLQKTPWPFPDAAFDHIVCVGVLHFVADLEGVFEEARRVLQAGGVFAFTTKAPQPSMLDDRKYEQHSVEGFEIFSHYPGHIEDLTANSRFQQLKQMRCFVGEDVFYVWVVREML